jgi:hypothetical protein
MGSLQLLAGVGSALVARSAGATVAKNSRAAQWPPAPHISAFQLAD